MDDSAVVLRRAFPRPWGRGGGACHRDYRVYLRLKVGGSSRGCWRDGEEDCCNREEVLYIRKTWSRDIDKCFST